MYIMHGVKRITINAQKGKRCKAKMHYNRDHEPEKCGLHVEEKCMIRIVITSHTR